MAKTYVSLSTPGVASSKEKKWISLQTPTSSSKKEKTYVSMSSTPQSAFLTNVRYNYGDSKLFGGLRDTTKFGSAPDNPFFNPGDLPGDPDALKNWWWSHGTLGPGEGGPDGIMDFLLTMLGGFGSISSGDLWGLLTQVVDFIANLIKYIKSQPPSSEESQPSQSESQTDRLMLLSMLLGSPPTTPVPPHIKQIIKYLYERKSLDEMGV